MQEHHFGLKLCNETNMCNNNNEFKFVLCSQKVEKTQLKDDSGLFYEDEHNHKRQIAIWYTKPSQEQKQIHFCVYESLYCQKQIQSFSYHLRNYKRSIGTEEKEEEPIFFWRLEKHPSLYEIRLGGLLLLKIHKSLYNLAKQTITILNYMSIPTKRHKIDLSVMNDVDVEKFIQDLLSAHFNVHIIPDCTSSILLHLHLRNL